MNEVINVTRSSMPSFEEYCEEIRDIWDSRWLTNMGVKHQALEAELKKYLDMPYVTLFTNGHLALENIIEAYELKGEIITTPFTFASTTHAIVRCGCTPVFCDINPADYTINADKIEALITERTVAIMPVHVYGNLCDVERIEEIARRYGLKVIYDAAHAFGVTKDGISSAHFGDASMFSFHATKVFHTIEGGAMCYSDPALEQRLKDLKNFGIHLRHLDEEIERRRAVVERYDSLLSGIPGLKLNARQPGVKSNYAYYPVVFDGYKYTREEIFSRLAEENIIARKYFYPLTNSFECYRGRPGFDPAATPVAQHMAARVLTLPLYADLSLDDVDRICGIILG